MASIVFDTFNPATLGVGNDFYAAIVNGSALLSSTATMAAVTPQNTLALTGETYTAGVWNFSPADFPSFTYTGVTTGIIIARRLGAAPAASDPLYAYFDFTNGVGTPFTLNGGTYLVSLTIATGLVNVLPGFVYSSGSFNGTNIVGSVDLFHLLGTRNGSVAWSNPHIVGTNVSAVPNGRYKSLNYTSALFGDYSAANAVITDRAGTASATGSTMVLDFGANRSVSVGNFVIKTFATASTYSLSGTNQLGSSTFDALSASGAVWQTIYPATSIPANDESLRASTNTGFYRYLRINVAAGDFGFAEFGLYNSQYKTTTAF